MDFTPLDPTEQRILGTLIEKALATPDQYPMTLNALQSGCNQKTNRDPVTNLASFEIEGALRSLEVKRLVARVLGAGSRVVKFQERLRERLGLTDRREQAVLTELLLRGPEQPGALRAHASRLSGIEDLQSLERILERLQKPEVGLVVALNRAPGERAPRYAHTLGPAPTRTTEVAVAAPPLAAEPTAKAGDDGAQDPISSRLQVLEARVAALEEALRAAGILELPQSDPARDG